MERIATVGAIAELDPAKMAAADDIKRIISRKMIVLARQIVRRFDHHIEQCGASRAKFGIIGMVSRQPGATQRVIADRLEVTEVTAGRLIERLCAEGLLERRDDPADRRAHLVFVTPAAQPMLDRLNALATEQEEQLFLEFDQQDLVLLDSLLDRAAANLSGG